MLTHERLLEVLHYDPETGVFMWKERRKGRRFDQPVGSRTSSGHLSIRIDGRAYLSHRLAWFYVKGEWPQDRLDHRDTDGTNNRFANLRPCTQRQNSMNTKRSRNNTSGIKGVSWHRKNKTWVACICVDRKTIHLGTYINKEDAAAAYAEAAIKYQGEFARLG